MLDPLSPLAHNIIKAAPYDTLVVNGGTPAKAREMLDGVTPDQLLVVPAKSFGHAYAMLAGLWLWHDALDECHKIAQMDAEALRRSALHANPKGSKIPLNAGSAESVENDQVLNARELSAETSTLSFWHAIMHRREGDFSNSKYWYVRAGAHPAMIAMANQVGSILNSQPADKSLLRLVASGWNAAAFVDLVESIEGRPQDSRFPVAVQLQQLEWKALFDYCARV